MVFLNYAFKVCKPLQLARAKKKGFKLICIFPPVQGYLKLSKPLYCKLANTTLQYTVTNSVSFVRFNVSLVYYHGHVLETITCISKLGSLIIMHLTVYVYEESEHPKCSDW